MFQAIHRVYGTRVIGLRYRKFVNGGLKWPLYLLDTNSCDYFFWGSMKDKCYAKNPTTKGELIKPIKKVVYGILTDMLRQVLYRFHKRIDFRAQSNG